MGVRGELFSSRVILPNRTYFFNVKENRMGDLYLNIVESKNKETGGFDRQSVILFADDLQEFLKGFEESLRILERKVREKRRAGENPIQQPAGSRKSHSENPKAGRKTIERKERHSGSKPGPPGKTRKEHPSNERKRV